jgi:hypothetical protein
MFSCVAVTGLAERDAFVSTVIAILMLFVLSVPVLLYYIDNNEMTFSEFRNAHLGKQNEVRGSFMHFNWA